MMTFLVVATVCLILFDVCVTAVVVVVYRRFLGVTDQVIGITQRAADKMVAEQAKRNA